jgi:hypothetical protein
MIKYYNLKFAVSIYFQLVVADLEGICRFSWYHFFSMLK